VYQYAFLLAEPILERRGAERILVLECLLQQPGCTATAAQLVAYGVVGTEVFFVAETRNIVETVHQVGR
jgi:hypothetical protein